MDVGAEDTRPQTFRLAGLALALVGLSLVLRAASFIDAPLDRDEGTYALIAQQWRRGAALYRDYFDHKPPLVYLAYRLSFALGGEHLGAVRVLFALANACTGFACALAVWRLDRRHTLLPAGLAGVAACVFLNSPLVQGEIANTETLMVLGTACSAVVLARLTTGRTQTVLLAGVCSGLAALAKPVALFESAFFVAWLATQTKRRRALCTAFAAGLVVPPLAWVLYAIVHGTLAASVDEVLLYNVRYASATVVPLWARLAALPIDYGVPLTLLWAGLAGCLLTALRSEPRPANFALGWTVAALAGTLASGRIYDHYYQQLIPPMAVALGATAAALGRLSLSRTARAACGIAIAVGLWPPLAATRGFAARVADRACAAWQPRLAVVIRGLTQPDDRLLVWGAEPYLAFAAERRPLSRFIYKYPLLGDSVAAHAARRELFAAWDERAPAVIVLVKHEATAEPGEAPFREILAADAPFHSLLNGFRPVLETSDFVLYTREDTPPLPWAARWEATVPPHCSRENR